VIDLLVANARIVDGSGDPEFAGSVAVAGDRITRIVAAGEPDEIVSTGSQRPSHSTCWIRPSPDQTTCTVPFPATTRLGVAADTSGAERASSSTTSSPSRRR